MYFKIVILCQKKLALYYSKIVRKVISVTETHIRDEEEKMCMRIEFSLHLLTMSKKFRVEYST